MGNTYGLETTDKSARRELEYAILDTKIIRSERETMPLHGFEVPFDNRLIDRCDSDLCEEMLKQVENYCSHVHWRLAWRHESTAFCMLVLRVKYLEKAERGSVIPLGEYLYEYARLYKKYKNAANFGAMPQCSVEKFVERIIHHLLKIFRIRCNITVSPGIKVEDIKCIYPSIRMLIFKEANFELKVYFDDGPI